MSIYNLENIPKAVKNEGLNIAVVCYGGCSSNTLNDTFEKNGYKCRSRVYDDILCHCPEPVNLDIPIIYIFRDPIKAMLSMKRRGEGIWDTNQYKLSNSISQDLSDRNLLDLMIRQFNKWTVCNYTNVLFLRYDDIFTENIVDLLKKFLNNNKLQYFPIPYVEPHINSDIIKTIDNKLAELFIEYTDDIKKINDFPTKINNTN